jgi:hypothetical protein
MSGMTKPDHQTEWVPLFFILGACYIVTIVCFVPRLTDVLTQGVLGIAMTFAGTAGGAYAPKLMQRLSERRSTDGPADAPDANPTQPVKG